MTVSVVWHTLLIVFALGCFGLYTVILGFTLHIRRRVSPASVGVDLPEPQDGWPSVCIIVPAHNEADVIASLIQSLRHQHYEVFHVVLVLDRCTDETMKTAQDAAASDERFEILTIESCAEGWSGKTHAAWVGTEQSTYAQHADMLLYTDADTIFHPDCLRASVALLNHRKLGMLSLLSTLTCERWFERVAQPVAAMELLRQNRLDRINAPGNPKAFANGQFMLFTKQAYEQIGGHEKVRDALLEDIRFAHELKNVGIPFGVHTAGDMVRCRMYRDWQSFCSGWKRIYTEASGHRSWYLSRVSLKLIGSGFVLPALSLVALVAGLESSAPLTAGAGFAGLTSWLVCLGLIWRSQGAPLWVVPVAPLGSLLVALLLRQAASDLRHDRGITWAGITYKRPAHHTKRK